MKRTILILILAGLCSCARPDQTTRVLSDQGYTNITITGYRWFTCDKNDTFCTGFKATTATGKQVTGAVGAGWFKGATIRLD